MLGMFTGDEAIDMCIGDDPNKLDLGTIIENADKGCVVSHLGVANYCLQRATTDAVNRRGTCGQ